MKKLFYIILAGCLISLMFASPSLAHLYTTEPTIEWNYQTDATASVNSGGFKNGATGTDWSIYPTCKISWKAASAGTCAQTSAVNTTNDLACTNAANSVCTSATYNFTAADVGNTIRIVSGTNANASAPDVIGRIISVATNAATLDINVTSGSDATAITANMGGGLLAPVDADWEAMTAGQTIYIKSGNYALTANISITLTGSATAPINVIGYKTTKGDTCEKTDRPVIDGDTNNALFWLNGYWVLKNIAFTTDQASGIYSSGTGTTFINVKSTNTKATGGTAFSLSGASVVLIGCEASTTGLLGTGITTGASAVVIDSYIHDCATVGIIAGGANNVISNNTIDTCGTGIDLGSFDNNSIFNNTIYGSSGTTGIAGTTSQANRIFKNIISGFTDGVNITTTYLDTYADWNNYYNNTDDIEATCIPIGLNDRDTDPVFTDAANGDFTITTATKETRDLTKIGAVGISYPYAGSTVPNNTGSSGGGAWAQ